MRPLDGLLPYGPLPTPIPLSRVCVGQGVYICSHPHLLTFTLPYSILGSWDGSIRLWKVIGGMKEIVPLGTLPAPGFINSLALTEVPDEGKAKGKVLLIAGAGQEHRFGRWWSLKKARNATYVFSLDVTGKGKKA